MWFLFRLNESRAKWVSVSNFEIIVRDDRLLAELFSHGKTFIRPERNRSFSPPGDGSAKKENACVDPEWHGPWF